MKRPRNTLSKNLKVNRKLKRKVVDELSNDIEIRTEDGESISDILDSLGPPKKMAEEFNVNFESENRDISIRNRILIILLSIVGIGFFILAMHNIISIVVPSLSVPYILSNVSEAGNSVSFMVFKLSYKEVIIKIIIELIIAVACLLGIIKLNKTMQKNDWILINR